MSSREKMLAGIVLVLLVAGGAMWGLRRASGIFATREARVAALEGDITKKEAAARRGAKAAERRDIYRRRSLPSNPELAQFQYRSWLRSLVDAAGIAEVDVTAQEAPSRKGVYERFAFRVSGRGSLAAVTKLLFDFYRADHLHQLRRIELRPADEGGGLELTLAVEALSLPQALRTDSLNPEPADRLALGSFEKYREAIVGRNLFAPYAPPPPTPPKQAVAKAAPPSPKPTFDETRFAFVTGILQDQRGELRVWLQVRTTGETLKLAPGESFEVGGLRGTVTDVSARQVEFETEGRRMQVSLGQSLHDAQPAADDQPLNGGA